MDTETSFTLCETYEGEGYYMSLDIVVSVPLNHAHDVATIMHDFEDGLANVISLVNPEYKKEEDAPFVTLSRNRPDLKYHNLEPGNSYSCGTYTSYYMKDHIVQWDETDVAQNIHSICGWCQKYIDRYFEEVNR